MFCYHAWYFSNFIFSSIINTYNKNLAKFDDPFRKNIRPTIL